MIISLRVIVVNERRRQYQSKGNNCSEEIGEPPKRSLAHARRPPFEHLVNVCRANRTRQTKREDFRVENRRGLEFDAVVWTGLINRSLAHRTQPADDAKVSARPSRFVCVSRRWRIREHTTEKLRPCWLGYLYILHITSSCALVYAFKHSNLSSDANREKEEKTSCRLPLANSFSYFSLSH